MALVVNFLQLSWMAFYKKHAKLNHQTLKHACSVERQSHPFSLGSKIITARTISACKGNKK